MHTSLASPHPSQAVFLKKGKESIFHRRHHWIFSGAVDHFPDDMEEGDIRPVANALGKVLGWAYFNRRSSLCGRIISFEDVPPEQALLLSLQAAITLRKRFFDDTSTTAYRIVNGEGDALPGLIVDRYGPFLVMQIGTLGMEKQKLWIASQLARLLPIQGIYEKSLLPTRKEEGLSPTEGVLWGEVPDETEILEEGLYFKVALKRGQKTGFFLDQREMRQWVRAHVKGRSVLNCFSYTGGFTIAALKGGASHVDSVDISEAALEMAKQNVTRNGFSIEEQGFYSENVFKFLKEQPLPYELIILDPPAFAKKKGDVSSAIKGYRNLNREVIEKMGASTLLLTCSCSYHIDEPLFQKILFQAALEAGRPVKILGHHRLGVDHPLNLFHPETDYLKSFLLYIA